MSSTSRVSEWTSEPGQNKLFKRPNEWNRSERNGERKKNKNGKKCDTNWYGQVMTADNWNITTHVCGKCRTTRYLVDNRLLVRSCVRCRHFIHATTVYGDCRCKWHRQFAVSTIGCGIHCIHQRRLTINIEFYWFTSLYVYCFHCFCHSRARALLNWLSCESWMQLD